MIDKFKAATLQLRKEKSKLAPIMVFHLAEIQKIGKSKNSETSTADALQYVKKTVGKLKEDQYADATEIEFLAEYLPKMATQEEIKVVLAPLLAEGKDKGQIMKAIKVAFGVSVDMRLVSTMI